MIHDGPAIHEKAHTDATCTFGDGTFVWQFASVIRASRIGQGCSIGANAIVDGARVGDYTTVGAGAQLHPGTRIGKSVFIGPGAIFCNDRWPRVTKGGFDEGSLKSKATVVVEDGASVGAGAIILPGVVIGKRAMVGAGAICDRPVPADHLLRRDGSLELMPDDDGASRRMKWAA